MTLFKLIWCGSLMWYHDYVYITYLYILYVSQNTPFPTSKLPITVLYNFKFIKFWLKKILDKSIRIRSQTKVCLCARLRGLISSWQSFWNEITFSLHTSRELGARWWLFASRTLYTLGRRTATWQRARCDGRPRLPDDLRDEVLVGDH